MSCGVGHRHGSDLVLLWLWCRPATIAPIQPPPWESPYTVGVALKRQKKKKKLELLFVIYHRVHFYQHSSLFLNSHFNLLFKENKLKFYLEKLYIHLKIEGKVQRFPF